MQSQPLYKCAECGLGVIVLPAANIRACAHNHAPIVAEMTATAKGVGGVKA